jgi:hypothetical protein
VPLSDVTFIRGGTLGPGGRGNGTTEAGLKVTPTRRPRRGLVERAGAAYDPVSAISTSSPTRRDHLARFHVLGGGVADRRRRSAATRITLSSASR